MTKFLLVTFLLFGIMSLVGCAPSQVETRPLPNVVANVTNNRDDDLKLAQLYAPVLYFHPAETYRPQSVDMILSHARLRQSGRLWLGINVLTHPTSPDLFAIQGDESYFLDEWFGDEASSDFSNYTAHQTYYQAALNSRANEPAVVYAHVVRDENSNQIVIQYWVLYFYNDWFNKHEGDWEMVEVVLSKAGQPQWVVLSQHHGGTRRSSATAPFEGGTHPVSYVAVGSHANYFVGDEIYPNEREIGNGRIETMDRTGKFGRLIPDVILIPDRERLAADPASWPEAQWIMFRGHWGEMTVQRDFSGPLGPADKGIQWEQPYIWGMSQPLDLDTWYRNRLRAEVVGASPGDSEVQLIDERGRNLPNVEALGNLAILHADPPAMVVASFRVSPGTRQEIVATLPNPDTRHVTRLDFTDVPIGESGNALLEFSSGRVTRLDVNDSLNQGQSLIFQSSAVDDPLLYPQDARTIPRSGLTLKPSVLETFEATWDAPDFVWMSHALPADQLGLGFFFAFMYSLVPTLVFVAVVYGVDLYVKVPVWMLAAAFMWGAIPALTVALVAELFFRLPPSVIDPHLLESMRLSVVAPALEEVLKGAGVLLIYWRHRGEFDDILHGMIYGAIVGFGFAMTANLLSYIGNFTLSGYQGLGTDLVLQRTVHAMDHGLFTAILGAGLGFSRLTQKLSKRRLLVLGALGLAISAHALHNVLAHSLVGLNILTVIVTGAGTLVIWAVAAWSLLQRRWCLQAELKGIIPESLYHTVLEPFAGTRAQWRALTREGIGAWRTTRRLHHLCRELAFKQRQASLFPDEPETILEAVAMRKEIGALVGHE